MNIISCQADADILFLTISLSLLLRPREAGSKRLQIIAKTRIICCLACLQLIQSPWKLLCLARIQRPLQRAYTHKTRHVGHARMWMDSWCRNSCLLGTFKCSTNNNTPLIYIYSLIDSFIRYKIHKSFLQKLNAYANDYASSLVSDPNRLEWFDDTLTLSGVILGLSYGRRAIYWR